VILYGSKRNVSRRFIISVAEDLVIRTDPAVSYASLEQDKTRVTAFLDQVSSLMHTARLQSAFLDTSLKHCMQRTYR
jgi:hypothetical protein